jgi:nucleoside-diphosphate-sugar epimerase/sulfatase maturation enzyme AslB (radical SAM superfamily)
MVTDLSNASAVLVTGAGGFVGRSLCRRLTEAGSRLFEINSENGGVYLLDNLMALTGKGIRHVFHLAGKTFVPESWEHPELYYQVNTVGTQNVLEFCRRTGCSLTFISSYLYGIPDRLPIDENAALRSNSPYAHSKLLAEELCRFYAEHYGVVCVILRPFNIYGPGQGSRMLIPHILQQVLAGGELHVSDLTPRRDYLYVEDFVDALLLTRPVARGVSCFNVGSGTAFSVEEIVALIQELAGTRLPVVSDGKPRPNEIPEVRADIGLLKQTVGWSPQTTFEAGLRLTIEDARRRRRLTPINKGNYTMEPREREERFERIRGEGWSERHRQYRRDWTDLPRMQKIREYPLQVDLELSTVCNLSCPMCFTRTHEYWENVPRRHMDERLFERIIDEIAGHVPAVRLSLRGEATLHPRFLSLIRYAKSHGIPEVSFLTNGSTMTPDFFEFIMLAGADWITFSVDGLGATYEKIRRPMRFERVVDTLRMVQRLKRTHDRTRPAVKVQTLWPAIKQDPQAYYDTFAPLVDLVSFNPLIDYLGKDSDIVYEESFACPQLYQRVLIGADGRALLCSNDEMCRESPGDANRQSIFEIWHGEVLRRIRRRHRRPRGFLDVPVCRTCYLPRRTDDSETAIVNGQVIRIPNYVNRSQEIGS